MRSRPTARVLAAVIAFVPIVGVVLAAVMFWAGYRLMPEPDTLLPD